MDENVTPFEIFLAFDFRLLLLHILSLILSHHAVLWQEPYLQSVCDCCSYRLDPENPVRFLSLKCESGENEPVVLPIIHSCECTSCQGESQTISMNIWHASARTMLLHTCRDALGLLFDCSKTQDRDFNWRKLKMWMIYTFSLPTFTTLLSYLVKC